MKTLFLIRHGKSDKGYKNLEDMDRPLNKRGYSEAYLMSNLLNKKQLSNQVIISSPAIRALTTAMIFCRNLNMDPADIIISPDLFESSTKQYASIVSGIDNKFKSAMIFGHNPLISNYLNKLISTNKEELPTCGVAIIKNNITDWSDFNDKEGELILFDFPQKH